MNIEVYEGVEGVKNTIELILKENEFYLIGATGKLFEKLEFFIENFYAKIAKKKLKAYFLLNSDLKNSKLGGEFIEISKRLNKFEYRFMPKSFKTSTQLYIFGDYSIVFNWNPVPISIVIKNKEIAKGFKSYFDFIWGVSAKV